MAIPKKIAPCPIIDCVIELRFQPSVVADAVFGIIYSAFKDDYPTVEKMPILNLPEQVRLEDPKLMYQAWYRLRNEQFVLAVGPRQVYLGKTGEYPGWAALSERMRAVLKTLEGLNIIKMAERIGLRYINFFEFDIFDKVKLAVSIDGSPFPSKDMHIRARVDGKRFVSVLQVANDVQAVVRGAKHNGSTIDIDTSFAGYFANFFAGAVLLIEEAHGEETKLFFSLLKDEFLETLNPEY